MFSPVSTCLYAHLQLEVLQDPHEVYTFGPQLGRGQFGVIYLITSKADPSQSYACKVLSKSKPGFSLSGVSDEVKALQQVSGHPNIVTLYQVHSCPAHVRVASRPLLCLLACCMLQPLHGYHLPFAVPSQERSQHHSRYHLKYDLELLQPPTDPH